LRRAPPDRRAHDPKEHARREGAGSPLRIKHKNKDVKMRRPIDLNASGSRFTLR
jgi:hypothetical protein